MCLKEKCAFRFAAWTIGVSRSFLKDSVLFSIVEWFHICMKHFESNAKKLTKLKNQFVFITDILF